MANEARGALNEVGAGANREILHPDVALVRPRDIGAVPVDAPVQDPLGVGYLAASLRGRGMRVVVVDAHALGLDNEGIIACLEQIAPAVVGLSLHSFADYQHCLRISRALAQWKDRPYCIWGGEHATFHAKRIVEQHPEVDAVVLGEGEQTLFDLAAAHLRRRGWSSFNANATMTHNARSLPVITYAAGAVLGAVTRGSNGRALEGGYRAAIDQLDLLPDPHKDVVEMALRAGRPVTLSVLTGRGCVHSCRFCTAHDFMRLGGGKVWRRRSPEAVADEVARLADRYLGNPLVHPVVQYQDVIFLGTSRAARQWVVRYLDALDARQLRVPFYCMTRADSILANEDLLPRLVRTGLWSVEIGIESGVERILQAYNKRNAVADNEAAVGLLRKHGVTYDASGYIMFDPIMTLDELVQNAQYLARFGAATWDFFVTRLQLYPGTALRAEMIERGLFEGEEDIGRTAGYRFQDPRVGQVADYAYYYDLSIRKLDLALRDAKAQLSQRVRSALTPHAPLANAVELVHETYCGHLLDMIAAAREGTLQKTASERIATFMVRVEKLRKLLEELLNDQGSRRARGWDKESQLSDSPISASS